MTWADFKKKMDNAGVADADEIIWIDIVCNDPFTIQFLTVKKSEWNYNPDAPTQRMVYVNYDRS